MPITIAHPCAVLPFAKLCPRYLNFAALVCGSMTPDLAYAFHQFQFSAQAHTFDGSFLLDLPSGFLLLFAYYWSKDLIASQLPTPHCEFWQSLGKVEFLIRSRSSIAGALKPFVIITVSILLGAWTHIIWDGFTHQHGFAVEAMPTLSTNIFSIGSFQMPVYKLLQYTFSAAGLFVLFQFYSVKLRKDYSEHLSAKSTGVWRFYVLVASSILAAAFLSLFQGSLGHQSVTHKGFVFIVNCMFMLPVVFLLSGLLAKYRRS